MDPGVSREDVDATAYGSRLTSNAPTAYVARLTAYEGLGNDIFYSGDYGRTIAVDIRYVLFVTEKFGNAGWILEEMEIKGGASKANRAKAE